MIDYDKAATKAAELLVRFNVRSSPISPLPILEQLGNVIVTTYADISDSSGICQRELIPLFGRNRDAITSIHEDGGNTVYIVAYNSFLPYSMIQRALARELGHIVLRHTESSQDNSAEAECFSYHLLCPRPLIHAIQTTGMRITKDMLASLTGIFDQHLSVMRKLPRTYVSPGLNRFVRNQFLPFVINFFDYCRAVMNDGSAIADFGTYMDNYEE